jgi:cytochrome c-type biogenesis protein CcmH
MSRRWPRRVLAVLVLLVAAGSLALASRTAPPTAAERAAHLDAELRCPVCQGLSVADSPSSTARAIATDVARRVAAGQSDQQIRQYYVGRYGPGILLAPSGTPGLVALALPLLLAALATTGVVLALRRGRRRRGRLPDARDEELVARLRAMATGPADPERTS